MSFPFSSAKSQTAPPGRGLQAVKRRQLVDEVITQLQQQISSGRYQVGQKIPTEPELMSVLGVSRTTVREAVRALSNIGLLDVQQGRGTYVRAGYADAEPLEQRLNRADMAEVYEVRQLLETEIARLAATHRTDEDLARIEHHLRERMTARGAGDHHACVKNDILFHNAIASACKNTVLMDMYHAFSKVLHETLITLIEQAVPIDYDAMQNNHASLFRAIQTKNEEEAVAWSRRSLQETFNLIDAASR